MTEINKAIAGSLQTEFLDDQSKIQYFQNPLSNVRVVIFGHTHKPMVKSLKNLDGKDCIYANSGTWEDLKTRDKSAAIDQDAQKMNFIIVAPVNSDKRKLHIGLYQYKYGKHVMDDSKEIIL
jgi:predicted phosphodiesterase